MFTWQHWAHKTQYRQYLEAKAKADMIWVRIICVLVVWLVSLGTVVTDKLLQVDMSHRLDTYYLNKHNIDTSSSAGFFFYQ
jgi:hypothetical protein